MTVLHPISSLKIARLAGRLIDDCSWGDMSRVEARAIIARMEALAAFGPAPASPGACVLAAHATRLSDMAIAARDLDGKGRDLAWLHSPELMDEMERSSFVY